MLATVSHDAAVHRPRRPGRVGPGRRRPDPRRHPRRSAPRLARRRRTRAPPGRVRPARRPGRPAPRGADPAPRLGFPGRPHRGRRRPCARSGRRCSASRSAWTARSAVTASCRPATSRSARSSRTASWPPGWRPPPAWPRPAGSTATGTSAWLWTVGEATGLPLDALTTSHRKLPADRLVLVAQAALFVVRDVFGPALSESLRSWSGRDLSDTALSVLYHRAKINRSMSRTNRCCRRCRSPRPRPGWWRAPGPRRSPSSPARPATARATPSSPPPSTSSTAAARSWWPPSPRTRPTSWPACWPVTRAPRRSSSATPRNGADLAASLAAGIGAGTAERDLRADRATSDQHLSSVRAIESRLAAAMTTEQQAADAVPLAADAGRTGRRRPRRLPRRRSTPRRRRRRSTAGRRVAGPWPREVRRRLVAALAGRGRVPQRHGPSPGPPGCAGPARDRRDRGRHRAACRRPPGRDRRHRPRPALDRPARGRGSPGRRGGRRDEPGRPQRPPLDPGRPPRSRRPGHRPAVRPQPPPRAARRPGRPAAGQGPAAVDRHGHRCGGPAAAGARPLRSGGDRRGLARRPGARRSGAGPGPPRPGRRRPAAVAVRVLRQRRGRRGGAVPARRGRPRRRAPGQHLRPGRRLRPGDLAGRTPPQRPAPDRFLREAFLRGPDRGRHPAPVHRPRRRDRRGPGPAASRPRSAPSWTWSGRWPARAGPASG